MYRWIFCFSSFFTLYGCEREVLQKAELVNGITVVKPSGYLLLRHSQRGFELSQESGGNQIEKVSYEVFERQELRLLPDSIQTTAFADSLVVTYGQTLKRNMGVFGGMMTSYLEYFSKFKIQSITTLDRGNHKWVSLSKKHMEEEHSWHSFYTMKGDFLVFITFFYMLNETNNTISQDSLLLFIDNVQFSY